MINYIKLTVISVIDRLSGFFDTTGPKQRPGAALINLSVTYGHEGFQEGIHDFQEISKLYTPFLAIVFASVFTTHTTVTYLISRFLLNMAMFE